MNNKAIIQAVERNGFEVKGKTKDNWKICYKVAATDEKYELNVFPANKKQLVKVLLKDIDYWRFIGIEEASSIKAEREIERIINRTKKLVGELNETK